MPLTEADQRRVDAAEAEAEKAGSSKLLVRSPPELQKLGSFTVMCLIINRTIGEAESWMFCDYQNNIVSRLRYLCDTSHCVEGHQQCRHLLVPLDIRRFVRCVRLAGLARTWNVHPKVPAA